VFEFQNAKHSCLYYAKYSCHLHIFLPLFKLLSVTFLLFMPLFISPHNPLVTPLILVFVFVVAPQSSLYHSTPPPRLNNAPLLKPPLKAPQPRDGACFEVNEC
jgi:hypothetical protein